MGGVEMSGIAGLQVGRQVSESERLHPKPQMRRLGWQSLNGQWDFCKGREKQYNGPGEVAWECAITVPFSPETEASGVADQGFYTAVWYRRTWEQEPVPAGKRLLVHFEAVDWAAEVWVNGTRVCSHQGGFTPFFADITHALVEGPLQEIAVRAEDDSLDLEKPRGKQDWKLEPHSIWYPRTTGIWQEVWLETVGEVRIGSMQWTSSLKHWDIGLDARIVEDGLRDVAIDGREEERRCQPLKLNVRLSVGETMIAEDRYAVVAGEVHRRIALSDPGIDDSRNTLLWSPNSPTLIDAVIELRSAEGELLDRVESYTAIRAVATQGDRFILNGRPMPLRLVLDQGYWEKSGLTALDDEALQRDIDLVKRLGFNGVRKHQKIESERFLYLADKAGLLVWEEMPSAYRYTTKSIHRLTREWLEVLERDRSHPCIIAWVPFNESWGVPDLPESPAQRHYVQGLYHLTKSIDPDRPVIGNDGWESVTTDIIGIHDYDDQPARITARYGLNDIETKLWKRERPGGRVLTLGGLDVTTSQPIVLSEFGGIAYGGDRKATWGYSRSGTPEDFLERYRDLLEAVRGLPALAGFCYTQLTDTYQEVNGLLYIDRTPKAPLELMAQATSGLRPELEEHTEGMWEDEHAPRGPHFRAGVQP